MTDKEVDRADLVETGRRLLRARRAQGWSRDEVRQKIRRIGLYPPGRFTEAEVDEVLEELELKD